AGIGRVAEQGADERLNVAGVEKPVEIEIAGYENWERVWNRQEACELDVVRQRDGRVIEAISQGDAIAEVGTCFWRRNYMVDAGGVAGQLRRRVDAGVVCDVMFEVAGAVDFANQRADLPADRICNGQRDRNGGADRHV